MGRMAGIPGVVLAARARAAVAAMAGWTRLNLIVMREEIKREGIKGKGDGKRGRE